VKKRREKRSNCKNQLCRFTAILTMFHVCNNEMPHKYGIKISELCEAKSGSAYNMCVLVHSIQPHHNNSFNIMDRLCDPIQNKSYTVSMDQRLTSPTLFDYPCALHTKTVGILMANEKEMPKETFSNKQKKSEKLHKMISFLQ
jgi:hypothetical protein